VSIGTKVSGIPAASVFRAEEQSKDHQGLSCSNKDRENMFPKKGWKVCRHRRANLPCIRLGNDTVNS
jgi:hypothetical protein